MRNRSRERNAKKSARSLWIVAMVISAVALTNCADMDQCSLGLCAPACPAIVTGAASSASAGGAGGGAAVCNPRGTVTTGQTN